MYAFPMACLRLCLPGQPCHSSRRAGTKLFLLPLFPLLLSRVRLTIMCAEQIRDNIEGKKDTGHTCDVVLPLSRIKAENSSNKIILNELKIGFVNWFVQQIFTDQGLQFGNTLWEYKIISIRPA